MKVHFPPIAIFCILVMLVANVFLYTKTIALGDELAHFEKNINTLKIKNNELEKKAASLSSLNYLSSAAENMGLNMRARTLYLNLNNLLLAKAQNNE